MSRINRSVVLTDEQLEDFVIQLLYEPVVGVMRIMPADGGEDSVRLTNRMLASLLAELWRYRRLMKHYAVMGKN